MIFTEAAALVHENQLYEDFTQLIHSTAANNEGAGLWYTIYLLSASAIIHDNIYLINNNEY